MSCRTQVPRLIITSICLRSGRPPAQDDDDMNVDLPSEDPSDNIGNIPLADGKGKTNLFRLMCTFAIIESKVYKQLYSTKASKQSDGVLLNTIGELDHELEEWKDGIPLDFRPEHEIKASHTPLILHIVVLHFAYYNCLTTIHRMSVHHGFWTSRLSNYAIQGLNARPLNHRVFSSAALCVQAARASIHLIKYIPQGDYACVWLETPCTSNFGGLSDRLQVDHLFPRISASDTFRQHSTKSARRSGKIRCATDESGRQLPFPPDHR